MFGIQNLVLPFVCVNTGQMLAWNYTRITLCRKILAYERLTRIKKLM